MEKRMNKDELIKMVKKAMNQLYENENILFNNNISERCLVYNFAKHFIGSKEFEKYEGLNVDLEYNRNCEGMKSIENQLTSYPDLILHERGSNNNNIMVIEFKKWGNTSRLDKDRKKLRCFKSEYGYELCMLIVFDKEMAQKVKYEEIN